MLSVTMFSACTPRPSDPLAYQKSPLSAEVILEKNGTRIGAVIDLGEKSDAPRNAEIVFTSPESVKGITVERLNGNVTSKLGELTITPDERALFIAELFSLDGTIIGAATENGMTTLTLSCTDADYILTLDADGRPKSIDGKDFTLKIVWLEIST